MHPNYWVHKVKRYSINGRWYWYETSDGGVNWKRISLTKAVQIIDAANGVVLR